MTSDQIFMSRCLQLASMGAGHVAPNPMVGAVLVHGGSVIGEGYHRVYGGPHAEVECLDSVRGEDRHLIPESRMYVSLEPCAHHGKTPPCADLVIREGIKEVYIACRDPFPQVDGRGVDRLRTAGVNVVEGIMEKEAVELNRRFFGFHRLKRPYIVLKWAESVDGMMAGAGKARAAISGPAVNRLVHRWRSEEQAILVGANTAVIDDPRLTARTPAGRNPLRIVIDRRLRLPANLRLFSDGGPTTVVNVLKEGSEGGVGYLKVPDTADLLKHAMASLHTKGVQSILVEGGRTTIDSFMSAGLWDECRIIRSLERRIPDGYPAPSPPPYEPTISETFVGDRIDHFRNPESRVPS